MSETREIIRVIHGMDHDVVIVYARDLTEFDILVTGDIVLSITPSKMYGHKSILARLRRQTLSGIAEVHERSIGAKTHVNIIVSNRAY